MTKYLNKFNFIILLSFLSIYASFGHSQDQSQTIPDFLKVRYGQKKTLDCIGLKRFLSMNPKVISVTRTGEQLNITPRSLGETSLIIWTDTRYRISVKVTAPLQKKSMQKIRLERKKFEKNAAVFNINYSYTKNTAGDDFSSQEESDHYQQALFTMESPFFKDTRLYLSSYLNTSAGQDELDFLAGSISNIKFPDTQNYKIDFGTFNEDTSSTYTNLGTIKGVRLSFLEWKLGVRGNPLKLALSYGEPDRLEGVFTSSINQYIHRPGTTFNLFEEEDTTPEIFKAEFSYSPKKSSRSATPYNFLYNLNLARKKSDNENKNFYDLSVKANRKNEHGIVSLGGETDNTGYKFAYRKRFQNINVKLLRSFTPNDAETLISETPLNENTQNQFSIYFTPLFKNNYLSKIRMGYITNNSIIKRNDLPEDEKWDHRVLIQSDILDFPTKLWLLYVDSKDSSNPQERMEYEFSISKKYEFYMPIGTTLRYKNTETERISNQLLTSTSDTFSAFFHANPFKAVNYSFSISTTKNENDFSKETRTLDTIGHSLNYSFGLLKNKMTANLGYSYYESRSDSNFELIPVDSSAHSINFSLNARISNFTKLRLSLASSLKERVTSQGTEDEVRSRIEAYFSTRFHTLFGWKPKTDITVIAFYDTNANGSYDENIDRPLRDIEILMNNKTAGITNDNGSLYLGKVKGFQKLISINTDTIPQGYVFSTHSKYEFSNLKSTKETCYFGLALNTEIAGTIYNDTNNNNKFDEDDEVLSGISVTLSDGKSALTDLRGRYYFSPVAEGAHELKVDVFSLPYGFRSKASIKRNVFIQKGSIISEDFSFQAMRILKGKIYKKEKGRLSPLNGVTIEFLNNKKTTSKKGSFKFTGIPKGKNYLKILLDNIPFEISNISPEAEILDQKNLGKALLNIEFSKDPETKEINIILQK